MYVHLCIYKKNALKAVRHCVFLAVGKLKLYVIFIF